MVILGLLYHLKEAKGWNLEGDFREGFSPDPLIQSVLDYVFAELVRLL